VLAFETISNRTYTVQWRANASSGNPKK